MSAREAGCIPHYNVLVRELFEPERPRPYAPGQAITVRFFDALRATCQQPSVT